MNYDPKHPKKITGIFQIGDQQITGTYEDNWYGWQIAVPPEGLIQASGMRKTEHRVKLIKELPDAKSTIF